MKHTFLILHYNTIKDTKRCVESIRERYSKVNIVIVDNGSPNNSGEEVKKYYKDDKNIHVVISKENLGFACGNNLGIKYIKDNIDTDFIIMINSDTYLITSDFLEVIEKEYKSSKFGVLGPRILLPNNKVSNYGWGVESEEYLRKKIKDCKKDLFFDKIHLYFIRDIYKRIYNKLFVKKIINDTSSRAEDVVLNGCALVFSKEFLNKFDGLYDKTFLYEEEQFLYYMCKDNNIKMVYNPLLMIYHNCGSSTSHNRNARQKRMFNRENYLKSIALLLEYIDNRKK